MSVSPTYTINNPAVGQEYIAPSAYWVVPASGTSVTVTAQTFDANGNLTGVSSLTAIRRNISGGSDAGSFTATPSNSGGFNPTTSNSQGTVGINGSNVFAPAGKVGSTCAQLRVYISYTGSVYDQAPNAPGNLAPSGTVTTLTPTFTGSFSDPTSGDFLAQYEIAVNSAAGGGGSQLWISGPINASSAEQAAAAFSHVYGGPALSFASGYSFRAHLANQHGNWGPWSGWVNFSTVQGPNNPTINAPQGLQTSLTPAWSFTYSSPASTALASYRLVIEAEPQGNWIYDSGWVSHSAASGSTLTGSVSAGANLQHGGQYSINFMAQDANGAQSGWSQMGFSVAALPQVAPTSPVGGATVTTQTPTLVWSYSSASGYQQAQAQIEVQNASTGVDIVLTGWLAQSAAQWVSTTSIPFGTQIRWRVQVQDSAGLASGWSAWATAYVNNAPSATLTAPTNASSISTVTPTVTWTYTASSGGQAQASAQIQLFDASSNPLATYTQSGAGTSFTLPTGVLLNGSTYQVQITVTDTNSVSGQSSRISFTVTLTPPGDMAGQPLPDGKNWLTNALLNSDSGSGLPSGWDQTASGGLTAHFGVDPAFTQPVALGNGDGPILGAATVTISSVTASGQFAGISQPLALNVPGWTAGSTVVSAVVEALVAVAAGAPTADVTLEFWNGATFLSAQSSSTPLGDTAGILTRLLGPQGIAIPANTTLLKMTLQIVSSAAGDAATVWWCDAQLEAAPASDANVIEGSLGPGYTYDTQGFSVRTQIAGGAPSVVALPGVDTDPVSAAGGTVALSWDTSLADSRFTAYLIERRRQDQASGAQDDTAWTTLATLTNKTQSAFIDYTAAAQTTYQYAIRQQIAYSDGSVGLSQHRAIAVGSVSFADAWYLTNAGQAGAPVYNMRLRYVQAKRTFAWQERATYSAFLGRVGAARDAGAPSGYTHMLVCYFSELRGDSRSAIRRQFITMQRLRGVWYLKDPNGLAIPVYIGNITFDDVATSSETILTVTLSLQQAQDTSDD